MKTPEVTIKVAPLELQILRLALSLYADAMHNLAYGEVYKLNPRALNDDPAGCENKARALIQDIGMW